MYRQLSVLLSSLLLFALLAAGGVLTRLDQMGLDLLFRLRGPQPPDQRIVLIGVDEASLQRLGPWPFPRRLHTQLLSQLHQARAIGFDFLFAEPSTDDGLFSQAMSQSPPVVLALAHGYDGRLATPSAELHGFTATGHIETLLGGDGVVRRVNLSHTQTTPPFALALLSAAHLPMHLPLDTDAAMINYYGPEENFLWLSYADVLAGKYRQEFFKDRLVLIGANAIGLGDIHVTPFTRERPTAGVEIQATIIANLLNQQWISPYPLFLWVCMVLLSLLILLVWPRYGERFNLLCTLGLGWTAIAIAFFLFRHALLGAYLQVVLLLALSYPLHLLLQLLASARQILSQVRRLDRELDAGLQAVAKNLPPQTNQPTSNTLTGSALQRHLDRLQVATQALSLQHHFLEQLLKEELPPLILWAEEDGAPVFANAAFSELWLSLNPDEHSLPWVADFLCRLQPSEHHQVPAGLLHFQTLGNHGRRYHQAAFHPLLAADTGFRGLLAIIQDITEIKELERVKDEVVAVVSHELKLPLTTILGYGEMLSDSLAGPQRLYAEEVCSQSRRLQQMIEDFLDIARLESGHKQVRRFPFPLGRMLEDGIAAVTPKAKGKIIRLNLQQPNRTTPFVGDESLLLQAVINLLDNAVKFSPPGTEVCLVLREEAETFHLEVSDQGPGIPAEERIRIFEKFQRIETTGEQGFGLGLHLVKQIIHRHGGEIAIVETKEGGARFELILPKVYQDTDKEESDPCE
ncbi:MAG: CHASE2 domain-containing protein [Desulfobulbus sp.]|nr:CHASE2 domain-containing protein [Desulfobulbus sp.]